MGTRVIRGSEFNPTMPRSGSTGDFIFRLQNLIKRGRGGEASSYWEATGGPQNLSETIASTALTGTIALTANSQTVAGTGTSFTTELHLGQFFLVLDAVGHQSFLCVVERIISNTSLVISRAPSASVSGKTGYRLPVIFAVDNQRGTLLRGNVVKFDKGTLFSVGNGEFKLNAASLNAVLTATKSPKVSIYNNGAGTYTHFDLGLPTPSAKTLTAVAGGTKGMQAATYGLVVTAERQETVGHGNPSPVSTVTITAGQRVEIDFGAMDATSGSNAWGVWATRYVDASDSSGKNYLNGPWFRVRAGTGPNGQVIAANLTGNKLTTEWLDAEIEANELITFNNDAPPDAEFVAILNGIPVWISCAGVGDTSPGPFIFPTKPSNIEAAPAEIAYPTSPPELILGVVSAMGRLYLLTANHLQIAQGTSSEVVPILIRPFWKSGFKNPYQLVFADEMLYGCTVAGPVRSLADGDEQKAKGDWAAAITEFSKSWVTGHMLVERDPLNNAVCYFFSGYNLNSSGFWTTRVWVWGLDEQEWVSDQLLTSTTQDMIVSGVAVVGDYLEFLMGGRLANDTVSVGTYRFDTGSGPTSYYLAPQFWDSGSELRPKRVGPGFRVTGKITSGNLKVYGAQSTRSIPVSDLEAGTNALATLTLSNGSNVVEGAYQKAKVKGQKQHTVRVEGAWDGTGERDRIDEFAYEHEIQGARR